MTSSHGCFSIFIGLTGTVLFLLPGQMLIVFIVTPRKIERKTLLKSSHLTFTNSFFLGGTRTELLYKTHDFREFQRSALSISQPCCFAFRLFVSPSFSRAPHVLPTKWRYRVRYQGRDYLGCCGRIACWAERKLFPLKVEVSLYHPDAGYYLEMFFFSMLIKHGSLENNFER